LRISILSLSKTRLINNNNNNNDNNNDNNNNNNNNNNNDINPTLVGTVKK
jgi:hypothetical protein